jgi:hypothetical protein
MRLKWYIIETTESPIKEVKQLLRKYRNSTVKALKTSKDIEELSKKLSNIFSKEKIIFMPFTDNPDDAYKSYIAAAITIPQNGFVHVEILGHEDPMMAALNIVDNEIDVDEFFDQLIDVLSHEFIHRKQFGKFKQKTGRDVAIREWGSIVDYICCYYEVETWAHMGYYGLSKGLTDVVEDILSTIKNNKKCHDRFIKKLYIYCKNDKEALNNLNKLLGPKSRG